MDNEREEVYERIPWETLEPKGGDRQWMVYAIAGAVTLGALAYSFTRNQPVTPVPTSAPPVAATVTAPAASATTAATAEATSPMVVAEADLYAVDPERVVDRVAAHAEWFAVEYMAFDGTEQSRETLETLLPEGVPPPQAEDETQVFVDWARASQVTQVDELTYQVEVLVRSLASSGDSTFSRQATRVLTVDIELTDEGVPRVSSVPVLRDAVSAHRATLTLDDIPEDVAAGIDASRGEVLGGSVTADGTWEVVVMAPGADGVTRPVRQRP
jgi:hypothetical protein